MPEHGGRTFDRIESFDPQSRNFSIREVVGLPTPVSKLWTCNYWLDQGREGACVGFGWSHELGAQPVVVPVTNTSALALYHQAQTLDDMPGENYEGTSVLAGAKAVQADGHLYEYRWAFGIDDVIATIGYHGPVVLGLNWYEGMMEPDANGFIHPQGKVVGGHCILARGVAITRRYARLHNSWGQSWGIKGDAKISLPDLDKLLQNGGEACVPVVRV